MIEETHWHPVALSESVAGKPIAVTLLGHALVLWRDDADAVQAWADQCPHRGAQLSLGQVVDGRLECPYHGWQYDVTTGACKTTEGAKVKTFDVKLEGDAVCVRI